MRNSVTPVVVLVLLAALAVTGCTAGSGASPSSAPSGSGGSVVVTLDVVGETYRIELTDPADIEIARKLLAGEPAPAIPSGVVVRGDPGVNTGYSWHIDPATVEFADMAIEVCDGRPSDVEANEITSDRFCPWSAKVVAIDE